MRILLVEDDPNKAAQLLEFLTKSYLGAELQQRRSYSAGLREIRTSLPDLVLLDMSLPNFDPDVEEDSGKFRSYGGRDVMHQIKRRALPVKVVIVTQFESFSTGTETVRLGDLAAELEREFPGIYVGTVYYNASEDNWKTQLLEMIEKGVGE